MIPGSSIKKRSLPVKETPLHSQNPILLIWFVVLVSPRSTAVTCLPMPEFRGSWHWKGFLFWCLPGFPHNRNSLKKRFQQFVQQELAAEADHLFNDLHHGVVFIVRNRQIDKKKDKKDHSIPSRKNRFSGQKRLIYEDQGPAVLLENGIQTLRAHQDSDKHVAYVPHLLKWVSVPKLKR